MATRTGQRLIWPEAIQAFKFLLCILKLILLNVSSFEVNQMTTITMFDVIDDLYPADKD